MRHRGEFCGACSVMQRQHTCQAKLTGRGTSPKIGLIMNPDISSTQTNDESALDSGQVEALLCKAARCSKAIFCSPADASARYIEKFRILEQPRITSRLCGELARRFADRMCSASWADNGRHYSGV
jgi:hypothetical protein